MRRAQPVLFASVLASSVLSADALAQQKPKPAKAPPQPTLSATPVVPAATKPAPPAPAPPPPPPWGPSTTSPTMTSTSGESLMPAVAPPPPPPPAAPPPLPDTPPAAPPPDPMLQLRVTTLEARLTADEKAKEDTALPDWLRYFRVSGYVQPQLLIQSYNTAASPNLQSGALPPSTGPNDTTAKANGTTTNGDYFRLRRARLKTEFQPFEAMKLVFEIDPTPAGGTVGGTGTIARTVEAQGIARWAPNTVTELAMGIFKIPFGFEVLQSDADRPFIERSWGEQNMTPGEFDTGARMYTRWAKDNDTVDVQLAVVNGVTEGEPTFSLQPDLNRGKDMVGRFAYAHAGFDIGVSGYYGEGQVVDPLNLRFKQFPRAAVNGEINIGAVLLKKLGATKLYSELTYGQNMDRGTHYAFALPAIPTSVTSVAVNQNELSLWARVEQDVTEWMTFGLRWDMYTPDVSLTDDTRHTFGIVGVAHFTKGLQGMIEFDHAIDHVHPAALTTTPPDRQIETGSFVLQARF